MYGKDIVIIEGEYMCFPESIQLDGEELWVLRGMGGTFKCYTEDEYVKLGEELSRLDSDDRRQIIRKIFSTIILVTVKNNGFFMNNIMLDHATSSKYNAIRKEGYLLLEPIEE